MTYEYKVIPAPSKGVKAKGLKGATDRFANALEIAINQLATDGWEFMRAETLPAQEREGLMGKTTVFQNVLVFRRAKDADAIPVAGILPPPDEADIEETASEAVEDIEEIVEDVSEAEDDAAQEQPS